MTATLNRRRVVEILAAFHEDLSPRERNDVLPLMVQGLGNQEIADELVVGIATVKTHVDRIMAKLGARTRGQAVYIALVLGLVLFDETDARAAVVRLRGSLIGAMNDYLGRVKPS